VRPEALQVRARREDHFLSSCAVRGGAVFPERRPLRAPPRKIARDVMCGNYSFSLFIDNDIDKK
ncbi:MAG: hypothetical protein R6V86_01560, partial [Spirochaetia bacterium]